MLVGIGLLNSLLSYANQVKVCIKKIWIKDFGKYPFHLSPYRKVTHMSHLNFAWWFLGTSHVMFGTFFFSFFSPFFYILSVCVFFTWFKYIFAQFIHHEIITFWCMYLKLVKGMVPFSPMKIHYFLGTEKKLTKGCIKFKTLVQALPSS